MIVEVWSDIMCPFCYIGKRKYETALAQFAGKAQVKLVWKSFQLDPSTQNGGNVNYFEHLQAKKGWSAAETKGIFENVSGIAKKVGLDFDFEHAIVANSFDAHRMLHFATKFEVQNALKEALLAAHFEQGADIGNKETLMKIGIENGLPQDGLQAVLDSDQYSAAVLEDIKNAQSFGISGVPFFVFDRKCAISGAQEGDVFLGALEQSFAKWQG
jgi:predicted DsbA family dithiol-disulfide isomerase